MTVEAFDDAVELAKRGAVKSCNGATDALQQALDAIIDADPRNINESVARAYETYAQYRCAEESVHNV
jgi:hypothetical protein